MFKDKDSSLPFSLLLIGLKFYVVMLIFGALHSVYSWIIHPGFWYSALIVVLFELLVQSTIAVKD